MNRVLQLLFPYLYPYIIRKTKRFAFPKRSVYFRKTKRIAGTPPKFKKIDRLRRYLIALERSPDIVRTPFFSFCRFAPALALCAYATSVNALYASTLSALTI